MKPSSSTQIGLGLLVLLMIYAAPYAWLRSEAGIFTVTSTGQKSLYLNPNLPGGKTLLSMEQQKILAAVYQPLTWMDSKLSGSVVCFDTFIIF